jgi:hypothetical protein
MRITSSSRSFLRRASPPLYSRRPRRLGGPTPPYSPSSRHRSSCWWHQAQRDMRGQTWSQCTCAAVPAGLSTCPEERLRTCCVQAAWSLTSTALRHSEPRHPSRTRAQGRIPSTAEGTGQGTGPQQKAQVNTIHSRRHRSSPPASAGRSCRCPGC